MQSMHVQRERRRRGRGVREVKVSLDWSKKR